MLTSILSFYDRFAKRNATNPSLRFEAARGYRRVAAIREQLGQTDAAAKARQRALDEFRSLAREFPGDPRYARGLAEVRGEAAASQVAALVETGKTDEAARKLAGLVPGPEDPRERFALVRAREKLADARVGEGRLADARDLYRAAIRDLAGGRPDRFTAAELPSLYRRLALVLRKLGDDEGAADAERHAREGLRGRGPPHRGPR